MQSLSTARLELMGLDIARDVEDLHLMFSDPDWASAGYDKPSYYLGQTHNRLVREFGDHGGLAWALRLRPDRHAIGVIGVFADRGTPIRGLSWYLRREFWGRGLMSEAAVAVVDHLLGQPGIAGVEAWIDSRNIRSIGVARQARLEHVGRLPRVYDAHLAQSVVMARASAPRDPNVIAVRPTLSVHDVGRTTRLLVDILGMHIRFQLGEPDPTYVRLGLDRWTDGNGLDLQQANAAVSDVSITIDLGTRVDSAYDAVRAAGFQVPDPPRDQPWHRREFSLILPEAHRITISGPLRPPQG
ncbi:GNAT family N-acetyltransferase [Kribbella sp. NBC_01505]|uniref:GNAT family N-acetyltransferase n=1 Tax=Kribbella sp. NBC_01505 TaxID=2903580 RepID=UPI003865F152